MSIKFFVVGICCVDKISIVENFPQEDQEIRALSRISQLGGNGCNQAKVLAKLNENTVHFMYSCSSEISLSEMVRNFGIFPVEVEKAGIQPESHILVSRKTGSRTIIHYRDLPELSFEDFKISLSNFNYREEQVCFHFEGRNVIETKKMLTYLKDQKKSLKKQFISIEVEKERGKGEDSVLNLVSFGDIIFFSKDFICKRFPNIEERNATETIKSFLKSMRTNPDQVFIVPFGTIGIFTYKASEEKFNYAKITPAEEPADTLGAGDVFIASFLFNYTKTNSINSAVQFAINLSAQKVKSQGFSFLENLM
eukprot:maker-scaffold_4-snap-gene-16.8-mRNA-1 protein AED:0.00 eAED:0.00 QI:102/1/1/1/0/0/3/422/308